jgi:hypothetical protein
MEEYRPSVEESGTRLFCHNGVNDFTLGTFCRRLPIMIEEAQAHVEHTQVGQFASAKHYEAIHHPPHSGNSPCVKTA